MCIVSEYRYGNEDKHGPYSWSFLRPFWLANCLEGLPYILSANSTWAVPATEGRVALGLRWRHSETGKPEPTAPLCFRYGQEDSPARMSRQEGIQRGRSPQRAVSKASTRRLHSRGGFCPAYHSEHRGPRSPGQLVLLCATAAALRSPVGVIAVFSCKSSQRDQCCVVRLGTLCRRASMCRSTRASQEGRMVNEEPERRHTA